MKICGLILIVIIVLGIAKFWERRIFVILTVLSAACFIAAASNELGEANTAVVSVAKNEAEEGSYEKNLIAVTNDGKEIEINLTIPAKEYESEKAQELLQAEAEALEESMLGENVSFDNICYDLNLPDTGTNADIIVQWQSADTEIISSDGKIQGGIPQEGVETYLTATLTLGDEQLSFVKTIYVYPSEEIETIEEEIIAEAERINAEGGEEYVLPDTVGVDEITWYEKEENSEIVLAGLLLAVGILIHVNVKQKQEEKTKQREERLQREYPEFISRLLLMLYSGTGVRTAFFRMAYLYGKERQNGNGSLTVFEEVAGACRAIENGSTEDEAYERMGENCRLPCYRKLSVLLVQNRKRGGKGFIDELEQEAMAAFDERKRRAEAAGSAASMKLLIPLGMMLVVVLALMMIPAFMSI